MCSACGFPALAGHWSDGGVSSAGGKMRLRFTRLAIVNRLLEPYRLKAHDDGAMPGFQLMGPDGTRVIVANLEELWEAAARLAGRPIDPLSAAALGDA